MRRTDRLVEDRSTLLGIFESADVCRLAFAVDNEPYIVCLNYGFDWEGELPYLYFHSANAGRKLEMMALNPHVCFELDTGHELVRADQACDWGMRYSSIVGYGVLDELVEDSDRTVGLDRIMRHYGGNGPYGSGLFRAAKVLRLKVSEMTGKRKE